MTYFTKEYEKINKIPSIKKMKLALKLTKIIFNFSSLIFIVARVVLYPTLKYQINIEINQGIAGAQARA